MAAIAKKQGDNYSSIPFNEKECKMARKKKAKKAKKTPKGLWTTRDLNLLKKLFPNNPTSKIAAQLRRKTDAVKKKASRMGLRKSKRYLKCIGRA